MNQPVLEKLDPGFLWFLSRLTGWRQVRRDFLQPRCPARTGWQPGSADRQSSLAVTARPSLRCVCRVVNKTLVRARHPLLAAISPPHPPTPTSRSTPVVLPASNYIFKSCQVVRMWWALIVEKRLGRLVITQSLSQLNTPRSLLQCCVSWLSPSSDTNTGLSWQLVISRYQTVTPYCDDKWDSSWAAAGIPASPQGGGGPKKGCLLVFPNQSSSPFVHGPAPNLPVNDVIFLFQKSGNVLGTFMKSKKKTYMRKSRWWALQGGGKPFQLALQELRPGKEPSIELLFLALHFHGGKYCIRVKQGHAGGSHLVLSMWPLNSILHPNLAGRSEITCVL